jgi:hypothetical protein
VDVGKEAQELSLDKDLKEELVTNSRCVIY